ncbi:MAG: hybrid sensor histidine kinase/response regulator [Candidatus Sericytochromatia bacterium]
MTETQAPVILVIDDQAQNLQILSTTLRAAGYQVAAANSGPTALRILEKRLPDLILCDIMMPEMDGYAVCRQLKSQTATQDIPLIFLTAKTESEDILLGFEVGAVDYVTKPFNTGELLARVKTHTELKRARDTILTYTHQLESLNEEKNHFLGIAAHDLKNPLTTIMLSAEMVQLKRERIRPEDLDLYIGIIYKDAERMLMIVSNLLDVNRIEAGRIPLRPELLEWEQFLQRLIKQYEMTAARKQITLRPLMPEVPPTLISDPHIVFQIADNLLSNAIKYSPPGRKVEMTIQPVEDRIEFAVCDQGPGLTTEDRTKLFQKFTRLSARPTGGENSTGLGLSIVKMLCELLQATIRCESEPGQGARFVVSFPLELRVES